MADLINCLSLPAIKPGRNVTSFRGASLTGHGRAQVVGNRHLSISLGPSPREGVGLNSAIFASFPPPVSFHKSSRKLRYICVLPAGIASSIEKQKPTIIFLSWRNLIFQTLLGRKGRCKTKKGKKEIKSIQ
ncbi:hypothetical protein TNCV_4653701 [Trichonephila clavipes]|nr:hypothetical protein TNCV_4653701 [Trichonephila clavipes]